MKNPYTFIFLFRNRKKPGQIKKSGSRQFLLKASPNEIIRSEWKSRENCGKTDVRPDLGVRNRHDPAADSYYVTSPSVTCVVYENEREVTTELSAEYSRTQWNGRLISIRVKFLGTYRISDICGWVLQLWLFFNNKLYYKISVVCINRIGEHVLG